MEENKETSCSKVLDQYLKTDEPDGKVSLLPEVLERSKDETEESSVMSENRESKVISQYAESQKEIETGESVPKDSIDVSLESRTQLLEDVSDISSIKNGVDSGDSMKEDELLKEDELFDCQLGQSPDHRVNNENPNQAATEVSERKVCQDSDDKSTSHFSEEEEALLLESNDQEIKSYIISSKSVDDISDDKDHNFVSSNRTDSENAGCDDIVDTDIKGNQEESNLEALQTFDDKEEEMVSSVSSCHRDSNQVDNENEVERAVFCDAENEENFEMDPLDNSDINKDQHDIINEDPLLDRTDVQKDVCESGNVISETDNVPNVEGYSLNAIEEVNESQTIGMEDSVMDSEETANNNTENEIMDTDDTDLGGENVVKDIEGVEVDIEGEILDAKDERLDRGDAKLDMIDAKLDTEDAKLVTEGSRLDTEGARLDIEGARLDPEDAGVDTKGVEKDTKVVGIDIAGVGVDTEHVGVDTEGAGVDTESVGVDTEGAGVDTESVGVDTEGAGVDTESVGVDTEGAGVDTESVGVDTEGAGVDTESAGVDTEGVGTDIEDTGVDTESIGIDTEGTRLDNESATINTESEAMDTEGEAMDTEGEAMDSVGAAMDTVDVIMDSEEATMDTEENQEDSDMTQSTGDPVLGSEDIQVHEDHLRQTEDSEDTLENPVQGTEEAEQVCKDALLDIEDTVQNDDIDNIALHREDIIENTEMDTESSVNETEDTVSADQSPKPENSVSLNNVDQTSNEILIDEQITFNSSRKPGDSESITLLSTKTDSPRNSDNGVENDSERETITNLDESDEHVGNENLSVTGNEVKVTESTTNDIEASKSIDKKCPEKSEKGKNMAQIIDISSDKDNKTSQLFDKESSRDPENEVDTISKTKGGGIKEGVKTTVANEKEMEVGVSNDNDTIEDSNEKSSPIVLPCGSIDISAMCETVIEESETSISLLNSSKSKDILGSSREEKKYTGRNSSGVDDDEEICIIPDDVPRTTNRDQIRRKLDPKKSDKSFDEHSSDKNVETREDKGKVEVSKARKVVKPTEVEKLCDKSSDLLLNSSEPRRTPGRPQRQAAKRAESQIKEIAAEEESEEQIIRSICCDYCHKVRTCFASIKFQENGIEKIKDFCSQDCATHFKRMAKAKPVGDSHSANANNVELGGRFNRKCAQCSSFISGDDQTLSWETMDYCNEDCLGKYQKLFGSQCANCKGTVAGTSLGKYCVRFGYDVKQFCCSGCLEEFKKGLKLCSYCLKDISGGSEGFLAPVGDKGQFKDFCTQSCMEKYDQMSNHNSPPVVVQECAVCNIEKVVAVEVLHKNQVHKFCSEPCFAAFRFVNGMVADHCFMCKKYFNKNEVENFSVYSDDVVHSFCSKTCMNVYILANRKIVPCHWCKVKKYNFDMIKKVLTSGQLLLVCSLNCLALFENSSNGSRKRIKCDMCGVIKPLHCQLHLTDNTTRNFCAYQCAVQYQEKCSSSIGALSENASGAKSNGTSAFPVISSVQSLASDGTVTQNSSTVATRSSGVKGPSVPQNSSQAKVVRQIIVRPPAPKQMRNKAISCRPPSHTKGTHCRPILCTKETQTDMGANKPTLIPVPVPVYVPAPMCMYSNYFPVPVPFPLPVPVPIFIPTSRNSTKGIMKEIKRIQEKIPTDPFEAELLMMAEIVAGDKKDNSDSDSDGADNTEAGTSGVGGLEDASNRDATEERFTPEAVDASNTFGDDMLQMALKMATELEEPTDLEAALTPSTITPQSQAAAEHNNSESEDDPEPVQPIPEVRSTRGRKRSIRTLRTTASSSSSSSSTSLSKRRRVSNVSEAPSLPPPDPPQPQQVEQEKPDANMCLKYTLGVNAWKRWVVTKNAELEKAAASNRKLKLFKTEILQQTADELNYSLCLFVKEVRKPNGQEYAPDTIYYLCLGIQQYLFENGRIDNIFTDPYYEKFTECLDEVAKKFATLYNDSQYIVTRVEEEHLWESKQLGAHSPHVLLSTLMFFNTKYFNLISVEEHMQLSFSHIMKHWKRNPNQPGSSKGPSGSRNVLLRFYPPQSALDANSKKKKVYEQQENEENPLRCPVKLYEFYLSKCPESVKTRNDVFYLLPERSCVPDSPVWYSTMALGKEPLMKMLHRVKMVKEINQALLKS